MYGSSGKVFWKWRGHKGQDERKKESEAGTQARCRNSKEKRVS